MRISDWSSDVCSSDLRPIAGALLNRIAAALGTDAGRLSGAANTRLAQDLMEIARTHAGLPTAEPEAVLDFVVSAPAWARAFLQLHRCDREASVTAAAFSDRSDESREGKACGITWRYRWEPVY